MCCFFSASAKPTLLWNIRWWVFWRLRSRLVWRLNRDISILVFQMHLLYHHPSMNRTIYFYLLAFPFDQFNYFFWLNFYNNTFYYSIESKFYSRDESILNFYSWYCTTDAWLWPSCQYESILKVNNQQPMFQGLWSSSNWASVQSSTYFI